MPLALKEPRSNTIVTIAGFEPSKRIDVAVSAMELVKKELPDAKLVVIGSMRSPFSNRILTKLKMTVSKKGLENNVSFLPNAKNNDKMSILASAKVLLHPTPYEHFGISIVEGMASGCVPIVPRNGGAYIDIIDGGYYGLSFLNEHDLSDKIVEVLTNDNYRLKLKQKAIQRSLSFTNEVFDAKMAQVIDHFF
jgi:glycosyltransferase involved in cell wall biosynthesis